MNSATTTPTIDHKCLPHSPARRAGLAIPVLAACVLSPAMAAVADGHQFELKARAIHFDRTFDTPANDRTQSGLGLQLNYESPYLGDIIGVGLSGYSVSKLGSSGRVTDDVLKTDGAGGLDGSFGKIAQAFVKIKYKDLVQAKLGRQLHNSMLLTSSTSRAVPNTYSGASGQLTPMKDLTIYGAVYDRWSSRTSAGFEGFRTDRSTTGAIKTISLLGTGYKYGALAFDVEYLRSSDFLSKFGLVGSYSIPLADKSKLKLTSGIHTSRNSGRLAVTGAESAELDDEDVAGSTLGATPSRNEGLGIYIQAGWKIGNLSLGGALSKFNGAWIEDNFAGDHGTNVFPTGGVLGDFSNRDERVWMLNTSYDWKDYVKGLTTKISLKRGTGAKNSDVPALGSASEREFELDVRYNIALVKGLSMRYRFLDYTSSKTGRLDGVKEDNKDHRLYLDYTYRF